MNDENDKKYPELTAHPLQEEQTIAREESVHVTEPLSKTETEEESPQTAVSNEDAEPLTEEEKRKLKKEEEKRQREEEKRTKDTCSHTDY